jgi:hypothetical protein
MRLKLNCVIKLLSSFAFNVILSRYTKEAAATVVTPGDAAAAVEADAPFAASEVRP